MSNTRQTTYEVTSQHQGSIMLLHQYISCNSDKYLFLMGSYESVLERYPELYRHLQGKVFSHIYYGAPCSCNFRRVAGMVLRDPGGVMKLVVGSVVLEVTLSRTDDSRHMQGLSGCVMLNTLTFMWTTCRVEGRWKAYSVIAWYYQAKLRLL